MIGALSHNITPSRNVTDIQTTFVTLWGRGFYIIVFYQLQLYNFGWTLFWF